MRPLARLVLLAGLLGPSLAQTKVNKCCGADELMVYLSCQTTNDTAEIWTPKFTDKNGNNVEVSARLATGDPDCDSKHLKQAYFYPGSEDRLILLPDGVLRHLVHHHRPKGETDDGEDNEYIHYDFLPGKYCLDKVVNLTGVHAEAEVAKLCVPEPNVDWTDSDFVMRKVLDPLFHATSIIFYLAVAIIYFIMPTLRDLVGNIVTTLCLCLIVSQAADMVRIFTEFGSHVSFIVADIICYTSLLGAFFWLNSLGFYIWKTFRSRNIFLRVTDGRKYCYYSAYAWTCTIVMGIISVAAHLVLELPESKRSSSLIHNQEVIGPLGMTVFFMPVAFTILVDIFFYATTLKILNRMNTYGRIHHKLKHSFRMYLLLFLTMSITWIFMLFSWLDYDGLVYTYIMMNALQAPAIFYICVINQRHVSFLVKKSCCYTNCICPCCRPEPECEWGDEMTAMNTGLY